jgi:MFS family permease
VFAAYILTQLVGLLAAQSVVPTLAAHLVWALATIAAFGLLAIIPIAAGGLEDARRAHPFQGADFRALVRALACRCRLRRGRGLHLVDRDRHVADLCRTRRPRRGRRGAFCCRGPSSVRIAFQIPFGWLSDVRDRRLVLASMSLAATLAAALGAVSAAGVGDDPGGRSRFSAD